jgi:hypothetical protein
MNKTPTLKVPLQTELRFRPRGYEQPPHRRACGATNPRRRFTSVVMTASKKVCHVIRFCILFHFLFLSLASGIGKGDTLKGILLREGSGPRAPY